MGSGVLLPGKLANLAGNVCSYVCGSAVVADLRIWGISLDFCGTFSVYGVGLTDDDKMAGKTTSVSRWHMIRTIFCVS